MNIGFASDHRGYKLKKELIEYFKENRYNVVDYGTNSQESCDYPVYAYKLGKGILSNEYNKQNIKNIILLFHIKNIIFAFHFIINKIY